MSEYNNYGIIIGTLVHRAQGYKRLRDEMIMSKYRASSKDSSEDRRYGLIANNVVVENINYPQDQTTLFLGTPVIITFMGKLSKSFANVRKVTSEFMICDSHDANHVYRCPLNDLIVLEEGVWDLVVAVPSPEERLRITKDIRLLNELLSIEKGSLVKVLTKSPVTGIVTNRGYKPELGPGIFFEIELLDDDDELQSRLNRYNNYYTANEIRVVESMYPSKKSRSSYITPKPKNEHRIFDRFSQPDSKKSEELSSGYNLRSRNNRFNTGDRIVWQSEMGDMNGTICWRSQVTGSKLQVHLGNDECKEASCNRLRTRTISVNEVLTQDEYNKRKDAVTLQAKNDVRVEDLLGIDQLDNCSTYRQSCVSALKDYDNKNEKKSSSSILADVESPQSSEENLSAVEDFGIGSMVEVSIGGEPYYGVIKFIGPVSYGSRIHHLVAGVELEEENKTFGDGHLHGVKYFDCAPYRGTFIMLNQCKKDSRFQDSPHLSAEETKTPEDFGQAVIPGKVEPINQLENMHLLCGKYKGIQGHNNSCYLDATLFSMFTFTSVFDDLLYRPASNTDIQQYEEVQRVLREEIVNPLRKNHFVRSDRVMKLRTLLDNLTSVTGLTCEEKDPEEFLTSLVAQVLKAEPYLKLSSNQEAYYYQLFVEKDERLKLPTVQQLFQQSFITSDIKLKEVPSCLIIQMPRFGKSYKMYPRILPSQILDVTDVIENAPRECSVCARLAHFECKECFKDCYEKLECFSFCENCVKKVHLHERRSHHKYTRIKIPREFEKSTNKSKPRHFMELFAVLCIETSHYVAFVKCGLGSDTPWCFFDSMADREGGLNGYNIPEMVLCPDLPLWLSDGGAEAFCEMKDDRLLDPYAKRLLCDAYMCLYQSTEVMMYR